MVVLQRHASQDGYRAPHAINHKANLLALESLDVETIIAINSTGTLTNSIEPGSLVVPDDFIDPWSPTSYFDDDRGHGVATFDDELRSQLLRAVKSVSEELVDGGVYLQTKGPRFETPAEAQLFSDYADIVGMTGGTEVTLACELGLRYATLCSVDNYVNGIADTEIDLESFHESVDSNTAKVLAAVESILESFDVNVEGIRS
jgi:5'-methylthioadenosine phosphorylase